MAVLSAPWKSLDEDSAYLQGATNLDEGNGVREPFWRLQAM